MCAKCESVYNGMIGGSCYFCRAGEHHECTSTDCPCCGERNRKHQQEVDALVIALRSELKEVLRGQVCR